MYGPMPAHGGTRAKHPRCGRAGRLSRAHPDRLRRRAGQPRGCRCRRGSTCGRSPTTSGRALGSGAVLESLRRTRSGDFELERGSAVRRARPRRAASRCRAVVPLIGCCPMCPSLTLSVGDRGPASDTVWTSRPGLAGGFPAGAPRRRRQGGCSRWPCPRIGPGFCTPPLFWANIDDSGRSGRPSHTAAWSGAMPHSGPCVEALWH